MKITISQYSQALFEATRGKSQEEIEKIIFNFLNIVRRKKQFRIVSRIIEKFRKIYNKENSLVEAEVITAKIIDEKTRQELIDFIKKRYQVKKVIVKMRVDKDIIGGIIVKIEDEIVDGSIVNKLKNLRKHLIS